MSGSDQTHVRIRPDPCQDQIRLISGSDQTVIRIGPDRQRQHQIRPVSISIQTVLHQLRNKRCTPRNQPDRMPRCMIHCMASPPCIWRRSHPHGRSYRVSFQSNSVASIRIRHNNCQDQTACQDQIRPIRSQTKSDINQPHLGLILTPRSPRWKARGERCQVQTD